jgi:hypothetical protein
MEDRSRLKILIVSQYFWPENFRVNDIVNYFKSNNVEVEILTGKPNYPSGKLYEEYSKNPHKYEKFNGCKVSRVPIITRGDGSNTRLFFNYLSFLLSSIIFGFFIYRKKKFDYIFTFGTSPLTVALTSLFLSKICRSKTILWVLDLWPEIIFELGILKNKYLEKILSKIIKFILIKTDIILAQSESYVKLIQEKVNDNKVYFFPSWPEIQSEKNDTLNNFILKNDFENNLNIFFTGSIGDAQNFKTIAEIIDKTKDKKIKWFIIGGGRRFSELIKLKLLNNLNNLELIDFLPLSEIVEYQKKADVLFLSLKKGKVLSSTIPGKFSTYLKYNKPILGLISGEVKNLINDYKVGLAIEPDNIEKFILEIDKLIELKKKGILNSSFNNHDRLLEKFDYEKNLDNLHKLLNRYKKDIFKKFILVSTVSPNLFKKNFILSGLNLAFLGHYVSKELNIYKNMYHWPDGLFKFLFYKKKYKKIPGRDLINNLEIPKFIDCIHVMGILSEKGKIYLSQKFKKEIKHTELPFGDIEKIKEDVPIVDENTLCLLTLPTPKQEQIAKHISNNQSSYKIICIGGALNMLTGEEDPCPKFLESYGLETIWRLKTDTKRRIIRLSKSLVMFLYGVIFRKFKNLKGDIEKENIYN